MIPARDYGFRPKPYDGQQMASPTRYLTSPNGDGRWIRVRIADGHNSLLARMVSTALSNTYYLPALPPILSDWAIDETASVPGGGWHHAVSMSRRSLFGSSHPCGDDMLDINRAPARFAHTPTKTRGAGMLASGT